MYCIHLFHLLKKIDILYSSLYSVILLERSFKYNCQIFFPIANGIASPAKAIFEHREVERFYRWKEANLCSFNFSSDPHPFYINIAHNFLSKRFFVIAVTVCTNAHVFFPDHLRFFTPAFFHALITIIPLVFQRTVHALLEVDMARLL